MLLILIIFALILPLSFKAIRNHYIDTLTEGLKNINLTLIIKLVPILEENRIEELDVIAKGLGKQIQKRITIIGPEGTVLADSENNYELMNNHKNRPEIVQALVDDLGTSLRYSSTMNKEMLYVATPVKNGGRVLGILRTSVFLRDVNNLLYKLKVNIIYIVIIVVSLSLLGALIFSKSLSKPIKELNAAARKIARGDFNVKVFLRTKDPLKELADSFNYMAAQIKTLFAKTSQQKEELNNIFASIKEGLCVLDRKGKIMVVNDSFKKIVKNDSIEGRLYWEVLRDLKFDELIKTVSDEERNIVEEIELEDKVYMCSATFCCKEEIVVTMHDITRIKNLENTKRDFVTNVSHELRTPLTAIKGFVETLEDETDKKDKNYLDIIKRNTDRVINIVDDLLLLSKLEDKGTVLELEEVDLKDLIENVLKIFNQRLKEKDLNLEFKTDGDHLTINADSFKLEQVFINLIDNAIKYTERGGIKMSLGRQGNSVVAEIQDTGICIPKEHLSRIFERFYVVDKSRSRRLGGTGLGLSIVKHIVNLHKGKINVENIPGRGTRFIVTLPVNTSTTSLG